MFPGLNYAFHDESTVNPKQWSIEVHWFQI